MRKVSSCWTRLEGSDSERGELGPARPFMDPSNLGSILAYPMNLLGRDTSSPMSERRLKADGLTDSNKSIYLICIYFKHEIACVI
jgi:hypothetical protein